MENTKIKSAYNFVDAVDESKVYKPSWAPMVSQDIPFKDGESGEIALTIKAETPIFIRNGNDKEGKDNTFSHFDLPNGEKQYFIPGSSLKGMVRNVLEIFSYSRLNPELVDDNRYAYRDLTRDSTYMANYKSTKVKAGWISQNSKGVWTVEDCGKPYLMHHNEVDKVLHTDFRRRYLKDPKNSIDQAKYRQDPKPGEKTAVFKYKMASKAMMNGSFDPLAPMDFLRTRFIGDKNEQEKDIAIYDPSGDYGTIVMTGQSGKRDETRERPSGKVHEFLFAEPTGKTYQLNKQQQKDFKFIYKENEPRETSEDWKFWRARLKQGERMPIFFTAKDGEILHFGLAFMYKLPYNYRTHEMYPISTYTKEREIKQYLPDDLATTMFGRLDTRPHEERSIDLTQKGRVYFNHAMAINGKPFVQPVEEILGGPKASYWKFYLQNGDYDQAGNALSGFKRYPTHNTVTTGDYTNKQLENKKKENTVFSFCLPLEKGVEFKTKIRFHNLRPIELGALLSTLTFHDNSAAFCHTIGGLKPFGYGKISLHIDHLGFDLKQDARTYMSDFEQAMNDHIQGKWVNALCIKKTFAMAIKKVDPDREKQYVYPTMDQEHNKNEFHPRSNEPGVQLPKYHDNDSFIDSIYDVVGAKQKAELEAKLKEIFQQATTPEVMTQENYETLNNLALSYPETSWGKQAKERYDRHCEDMEFERIMASTDQEEIELYCVACLDEDRKKKIQGHKDELIKARKEKEREALKNQDLNLEPNYNAILNFLREIRKAKLELNDEQLKTIHEAILASFKNEDDYELYKKNLKKQKGPWKEFTKNGLNREEVKVLVDEFKKL